jgi:hypothetical protein
MAVAITMGDLRWISPVGIKLKIFHEWTSTSFLRGVTDPKKAHILNDADVIQYIFYTDLHDLGFTVNGKKCNMMSCKNTPLIK